MLRQSAPKILILENQLIIAADVALQLSKLGYHILGISTCSDDLFKTIINKYPDIILMNLKRQNKEDRIKTAGTILRTFQIPVIFLSAYTDPELFKQVIQAQPYAFISKPFKKKDLQRGLETTLDRMNAEGYWNENYRQAPKKVHNNLPSGFPRNRSDSNYYHSDNYSKQS